MTRSQTSSITAKKISKWTIYLYFFIFSKLQKFSMYVGQRGGGGCFTKKKGIKISVISHIGQIGDTILFKKWGLVTNEI